MKITKEMTEDGKTVLKTENKQHTVMNLVKKYLWDSGVDSGYDKGHPYLGGSNLLIDSEDPKEDIEAALEDIRNDLDSFKKAVQES